MATLGQRQAAFSSFLSDSRILYTARFFADAAGSISLAANLRERYHPVPWVISSVVERFVHIEDVSGSNPLSPTIFQSTPMPKMKRWFHAASWRCMARSSLHPSTKKAKLLLRLLLTHQRLNARSRKVRYYRATRPPLLRPLPRLRPIRSVPVYAPKHVPELPRHV